MSGGWLCNTQAFLYVNASVLFLSGILFHDLLMKVAEELYVS